MPPWKIALSAALPAAALLLLISLSFIYCLCGGKWKLHVFGDFKHSSRFCRGAVNLGSQNPSKLALRHSSSPVATTWRTAYPIKPFIWNDHPALIAEAVEHGWTKFGFTHTCSTCRMPSNLWDMCTGCSHGLDNEPEISWEMGAGSVYMQKVRLNPRLRMKRDNAIAIIQVVQAALPLPGPPLGYPQEGYYEITVFAEGHNHDMNSSQNSFNENENVKLISKQFSSTKLLSLEMPGSYSDEVFENTRGLTSGPPAKDAIIHKTPAKPLNSFEMIQIGDTELRSRDPTAQVQILAIGLAPGTAPPFRFPGCDAGSVGFHSNGRVYLNGALHIEQEPMLSIIRRKWGYVNTIVGCGFDPGKKRIFFTLNGEIVCELITTTAEFGCPLYPTIASNYDVTVLVNFGQSSFRYSSATSEQILDPHFKHSTSAKDGSVNEGSEDLFSMDRIDAQWLGDPESPSSQYPQHRHALSETESDLFEIVLDA